MSTVSSLGSAQITSEITQVETRLQVPITSLDAQASADQADISAWGTISGAVSTLSKSLAGISDVSTINNRTVASTLTTVATATAAIGAQNGTYNLTGVTLAKSQETYSAIQASPTATLAGSAGSLTFTLASGKTESVAVGSGSLTLNGIAAAINKTPGGVQASVVGTSTGARLVLQSSSTGSSQAFSVAGTGALSVFSYSSATPGTEVTPQKATDAAFNINGVPVTSKTNSVSSAITGVALSLVGSGATTVTVSSAPTALSAAVSSVATSLNAALSAIAKEIAFVPASSASSTSSSTPTSGPLLGNFTATNLSDQLLTSVSGAAASGMSANAIGLTVSSAGAVTFNSTTFAAAYAQNPTAVQNLVGQIYGTLSTISTAAIGGSGSSITNSSGTSTKSTGSIGAQTASLQGMITSINSQVSQMTKENDAQLEILVQEYTAAEDASTQASITQSYLDVFTGSSSSSSG
jgi:flagellar hook-associated protein 2